MPDWISMNADGFVRVVGLFVTTEKRMFASEPRASSVSFFASWNLPFDTAR